MKDPNNEVAEATVIGGTLEVRTVCPKCSFQQHRTIDHRIVEISGIQCPDCDEMFSVTVQPPYAADYRRLKEAVEHYADENVWICGLETCRDPECDHPKDLYLGVHCGDTDDDPNGYDWARVELNHDVAQAALKGER